MGSKLFYSQRAIVLSVDEQRREFVTMDYTDDKVILTAMDYEGKRIGEKNIAVFNSRNYLQQVSAISPDKRYFVYLNRADRSLYLHDFETGEKTKIIEKQLVSSELFLTGMCWISDTEFLIFKMKGPPAMYSPLNDSSLTRFNAKTKKVVKKIELTNPEKYRISPLKNYLLLLDSDMVYPDLKLFDLKNLELLDFRKNSGFDYITQPCWSPSEEYIGYIKKKSIIIRSRNSGSEKVVKVLTKDAICYHLAFLNENTIIFTYGTEKNPDDENILRAIDLTTGKESILLKGEILSGSIYVIDNGKKLIAEVGN